MVREAQKLMADPNFQAYMNQMMASPQFQSAMSQTKQDLQDPAKAKEMEEKAKRALQEGDAELQRYQEIQRQVAERRKELAKQKEQEQEQGKTETETNTDDNNNNNNNNKDDDKEDTVGDMPDIPALNIN